MSQLRKYFLSGIATILPVGLTVFIFWFLISRLGNLFRPLLARHVWLSSLPAWLTTLVGFVLVLITVLAIGALTSGIVGRWLVGWLDRFMNRVPLVKGIYGSARQLTEAVFVRRSSLSKTVIAEYPRHGLLAVGFLTTDERIELQDGRKAVFVYFPTTPNPTSGWLALIPEDELTETGMTTDEGLKLVVSGGVVKPAEFGRWVKSCRVLPKQQESGLHK